MVRAVEVATESLGDFIRLPNGLIRGPDVAFDARADQPGGKQPSGWLPTVVPTLAIEVLSRSNTEAEMRQKMDDHFDNGARQVWLVRPGRRTIDVHTSTMDFQTFADGSQVTGGVILPGVSVEITALFDRLPPSA